MVAPLFRRKGLPLHRFPTQLVPQSFGGHFLWPLTRLQITRLEPQPPLTDHYSRLFFGRQTAVQVRQPFFLWQPVPRIDDPQPIDWRADHNLNRYRTTFQTVGQSWSTWPKYQQPSIEPELIRQPDHTALNRYRFGFQTVGQPWSTWRAYKQPDFEPEKISSPQYELYPYRQITTTVAPGQPWYFWPPIQITIDPEEKMFRENHDLSLYPFRPHDAVQPVATDSYSVRRSPHRRAVR